MSIVRAPRSQSPFACIPRTTLEDERLSYRARGVLCALLAKPDGWRTDSTSIAKAGREGREAVRTALRELEAAGYLTRRRVRRDDGTFGWEAVVYDTPGEAAEAAEAENAQVAPAPKNPSPENPPPVSRASRSKNSDARTTTTPPTPPRGGIPGQGTLDGSEVEPADRRAEARALWRKVVKARGAKAPTTTERTSVAAFQAQLDAGRTLDEVEAMAMHAFAFTRNCLDVEAGKLARGINGYAGKQPSRYVVPAYQPSKARDEAGDQVRAERL